MLKITNLTITADMLKIISEFNEFKKRPFCFLLSTTQQDVMAMVMRSQKNS